MGISLWDHVWLPLLIGVAIAMVVAALRFLSVGLWNCLMRLINTQTAVGESAHDQPLPDSAAAAHANGVPDLEMGNGYGPVEGKIKTDKTNLENPVGECGTSVTKPELELGLVNSGEGIEHFSHQETHTPVIKSPVTNTSEGSGH